MPTEPTPEPSALTLTADFPAPTREQWRDLVAAVLAKSGVTGDPEDALTHTTYDGIAVRPLYTADDAEPVSGSPGVLPFVRGATADGAAAAGWDVRTRHADADAARANDAILEDLERGGTSLWLVLGDGGLAVSDLAAALKGVYLDLAPIVLDAGTQTRVAAEALLALGTDPAELSGSLGADPIGTRARTGADADLSSLGSLASLASASPQLRVATADGTVFHDAGASDAQELGLATAVGVAYLRALTDAGLSVADALERIDFRFAVTADQFASIAKLRAARQLWARVAELSGVADPARGQYQHAVTSHAMLTARDPWVNMLRTTIACFAGAVGGADAVTVAPFDSAIGRSDSFARRIARNTSAVLHDESSLARVVDPAGGSWYVESLTSSLAEAAWDVFTAVERAGGALAALDDGTVESLIAPVCAARDADIAHRRAPITGVSEFAFVGEAPVERDPLPVVSRDGALLPSIRYAQAFEAFRDRADAAPSRPRVFLATLGPASVHSARSGFAANLFQSGGLECVTGPVEEFAASGTSVVCLCSSDKVYAEQAADAVAALKAAGAAHVWLAGKAAVDRVDGTVSVGCDVLAVLTTTFETLGVDQ